MFTFSDSRTDALIRVLRAHPGGANLVEIAMAMTTPPPRRTLQRWLAKLVAARLVRCRGRARNTRYFAGDGRVALPVKKRQPKPPAPVPVTAPRPVVKPAPMPVAPPSRLPPQFRPVFDRIAPKIIRMGYGVDVAMGVLIQAAGQAFGPDDSDLLNSFVMASLDELDGLQRDATLAKYSLRVEDWTNWRTKWCSLRNLRNG